MRCRRVTRRRAAFLQLQTIRVVGCCDAANAIAGVMLVPQLRT
jgi:hypothetical protein